MNEWMKKGNKEEVRKKKKFTLECFHTIFFFLPSLPPSSPTHNRSISLRPSFYPPSSFSLPATSSPPFPSFSTYSISYFSPLDSLTPLWFSLSSVSNTHPNESSLSVLCGVHKMSCVVYVRCVGYKCCIDYMRYFVWGTYFLQLKHSLWGIEVVWYVRGTQWFWGEIIQKKIVLKTKRGQANTEEDNIQTNGQTGGVLQRNVCTSRIAYARSVAVWSWLCEHRSTCLKE